MAISVIAQPELIEPVYNPFYVYAQSNNVNQPNFQYFVQLFLGLSGGNPITTYLIDPRPDAIGSLQFSPARALESYVSYDLALPAGPPDIVGSIAQGNAVVLYTLAIGESYGFISTGITIYSGLTSFSGYAFNAVQTYQQLPNWNYTGYTSNNRNFLTNAPSPQLVNINSLYQDLATLSFFNNIPGSLVAKYMRIITYTSSGVQTSAFSAGLSAWSGVSPNNIIQYFGTGPDNLNLIPSSSILGGAPRTPLINQNTDSYYTCQLQAGVLDGYVFLSPPITYQINTRCTKYQPVRLIWLNQLGSWDFFSFQLISRSYFSSNKDTFKKVLPYNYVQGMRGTTVLNQMNQQTALVNSDWINDAQINWLITDLYNSDEVYELNNITGAITPIIITDKNKEIQKQINDKLFQIPFEYEYAFEYNAKRN